MKAPNVGPMLSVLDDHAVDAPIHDSMESVSRSVPGAVIGTLVSFDGTGVPVVELPGPTVQQQVQAQSCLPLDRRQVGRKVVLVFEAADLSRPIIIGVIQSTGQGAVATQEAVVDGRTVVLDAQDTITLRCGEASITLNRHGKIVIRGVHVVSHADGVNRIRGGSVQLN